jgi:hypothetical protein
VSLAGHGSESHSRDDPRAQRMPRRGKGMSIPCTQNIRDATGTGQYTLGTGTVPQQDCYRRLRPKNQRFLKTGNGANKLTNFKSNVQNNQYQPPPPPPKLYFET